MAYLNDTSCCGLRELEGLERVPENNIRNMLEDLVGYDTIYDEDEENPDTYLEEDFAEGMNFAFILFTDIVRTGNGERLCQYIRRYKLGQVVETNTKRNPNSGNNIQAWIWEINHERLLKWYKNNK